MNRIQGREPLDASSVNPLYRSSVRRAPRIRCFIDFVTHLFDALDRNRSRAFTRNCRRPNASLHVDVERQLPGVEC